MLHLTKRRIKKNRHGKPVNCQLSRPTRFATRSGRANVKCQSGFSLLELLIYIAILSVIAVVVANIMMIASRGRAKVEARAEVDANLNFALNRISRDVAAATAIATPTSAGASSSTLEVTVGGSAVKYYIIGDRLVRQVGAQSPDNVTAGNVIASSSLFTRLENGNSTLAKKKVGVEVSLTVDYNSSSPDWLYSQTKETTFNFKPDL